MPSSTRRRLIDESRVGTYHCSSRCVRRSSFRDRTVGGLDLDHRQEWVAKRLRAIAELFAIDVTDFAVIDNEFHAVLRNRPDLAAQLSDEQVIRRWFRMSRRGLNLLEEMGPKKLKYWLSQRKKVAEFRRRLSSISWLMIMLKEPIARANNPRRSHPTCRSQPGHSDGRVVSAFENRAAAVDRGTRRWSRRIGSHERWE